MKETCCVCHKRVDLMKAEWLGPNVACENGVCNEAVRKQRAITRINATHHDAIQLPTRTRMRKVS